MQNSKDPQIHECKRTKPINFQSTAEHNNLQSIVDGSWSLHSLRPAKQFYFPRGFFSFSQRDGHHHVIRIEKLALRIQIQKQTQKKKTKQNKTKTKTKKGGKQQMQVVIAVGSASKQAKCMTTDVHTYLRGATNAMKSTKKGAAMATQTMT